MTTIDDHLVKYDESMLAPENPERPENKKYLISGVKINFNYIPSASFCAIGGEKITYNPR